MFLRKIDILAFNLYKFNQTCSRPFIICKFCHADVKFAMPSVILECVNLCIIPRWPQLLYLVLSQTEVCSNTAEAASVSETCRLRITEYTG